MATAKWATPGALSSSLVTTELDSLANAGESVLFIYDNSSNLDLYAAVTIKLGSITPSAGGSVTIRVLHYDGTNTPDKAGGDLYTIPLASGASAKVVTIPMIRLYPFSLRMSITNNSGVTFNAADNDVYVRTFNESVSVE
jgi:hypothetical protein